jgi:hypothetical protein
VWYPADNDAEETENAGREECLDNHVKNWSRTYWVLILNQLLVLGPVATLAAAVLHEAYQACEAASLELPGITEWYFLRIGPIGLLLAGLLSSNVSLCALWLA